MQQFGHLILFSVVVATMQLAQAQRSPYAGIRPMGGLSQKEKYHTHLNGTQIATRFGGPASNATQAPPPPLAQLPPPSHVPVVYPQPAYAPLPAAPTFDIDLSSRFGSSSATAGANTNAIPNANTNTNANTISNANVPLHHLPLDAHGDRELVNKLNSIPEDQRPFWFLNYQAIEAQRNSSIANSPGGIGARGFFLG